MGILDRFLGKEENLSFKKNLRNVLGFTPGKLALYKAALTHRSVRDNADRDRRRLISMISAQTKTFTSGRHRTFRPMIRNDHRCPACRDR